MLTKNTEQLKQRVAEHVAADSIIQGIYWDTENLCGCFIGCLAHDADPSINEAAYGMPIAVQRIAENIFEAIPADEAKAFFAALPDAVGCDGKDLSKVHWQFLAAELRSLPPQPNHIQAAIEPVIAGMDLLAQGLDWPVVAAWAAADAAGAAADAAWAAEAARAAARAAAEAAAAVDCCCACGGGCAMTTDFRALCVELLDCLEKADWPPRYKVVFQQWADIARTALAEPEPEGPTDEEIDEMAWNWYSKTGSTWYQIESFRAFARAVLARWGAPNLAETRRSLTDAWAAHQPAIEAAAKAGMDACRVDGPAVSDDREPASVTTQPSDHLYVHFASLEWKLGCHMAEWKAAGDELNQAHCDGVVRLLREHLEGHGQA